jgi:ABC-type multidrug transport system permease subunit
MCLLQFLKPTPDIPVWFKWLYYINPNAYFLEGESVKRMLHACVNANLVQAW